MTVTIGLPIYNAEKFLSDCIKSILNQTYKNLEIILVNDGSTDNSYEIMKKFKDPRIKIINDGSNKGLIYRLNQMIEMSRGEIFVRMDADDIMFANRIEKQLAVLESDQNIDLVHGDAVSINNKNQVIGFKKALLVKNKQNVLAGIVPIHPTVMAKKEWFKKNLYDKEFILIEDLELWYRTIETSNYYCINEPLIFYREISQNNSSKYLKSIPSRVSFTKKYKLGFFQSIKFSKINYLKFLYHLFFEKLNLKKYSVLYRSSSFDKIQKDKYQNVLQRIIN